jgi:hypothetical protein
MTGGPSGSYLVGNMSLPPGSYLVGKDWVLTGSRASFSFHAMTQRSSHRNYVPDHGVGVRGAPLLLALVLVGTEVRA